MLAALWSEEGQIDIYGAVWEQAEVHAPKSARARPSRPCAERYTR
jgi:hypothetical protein